MAKTAKEYSEILKACLQMQIRRITEGPDYECSDFLQGQEMGLLIAIDKIEKAQFLTD